MIIVSPEVIYLMLLRKLTSWDPEVMDFVSSPKRWGAELDERGDASDTAQNHKRQPSFPEDHGFDE